MANLPVPAPISEADYEAIEAAVMETARGRWFLAEYARRNRNADTTMLLKALDRIEAVIRGERSVEPVDRIRFDLVEMSKAIARTKTEIAAMKPDADHHGKFGEATEELDSVVQATEAATSDILECAERIQEIAWTLREQGLDAEACDLLDAKATEVYTACSFQDLTGQRTRKVIGVLRYLEGRINAMIEIWGLDGALAAEAAEKRAVAAGKALLNGPAQAGAGARSGRRRHGDGAGAGFTHGRDVAADSVCGEPWLKRLPRTPSKRLPRTLSPKCRPQTSLRHLLMRSTTLRWRRSRPSKSRRPGRALSCPAIRSGRSWR